MVYRSYKCLFSMATLVIPITQMPKNHQKHRFWWGDNGDQIRSSYLLGWAVTGWTLLWVLWIGTSYQPTSTVFIIYIYTYYIYIYTHIIYNYIIYIYIYMYTNRCIRHVYMLRSQRLWNTAEIQIGCRKRGEFLPGFWDVLIPSDQGSFQWEISRIQLMELR